jgi:hypothetical protein
MTPAALVPHVRNGALLAVDVALGQEVLLLRSDTVPRIRLLDLRLRSFVAEDVVASLSVQQQGVCRGGGVGAAVSCAGAPFVCCGSVVAFSYGDTPVCTSARNVFLGPNAARAPVNSL